MKADRLDITLSFGNADMLSLADAAQALRRLAQRLEAGEESGKVMDPNGNSVGTFELKGD